MADARQCDSCGSVLALDRRGEDEAGEIEGWIQISIAGDRLDACTRSCATELLSNPAVIAAHEHLMEAIAEVVRSIRESREEEGR